MGITPFPATHDAHDDAALDLSLPFAGLITVSPTENQHGTWDSNSIMILLCRIAAWRSKGVQEGS